MEHLSTPEQVTAFVALGSNLGDRREQLRRALRRLAEVNGVHFDPSNGDVAPLYESSPVETPGEQQDYLNSVVRVSTTLPPRELLDAILSIEKGMGRIRTTRGAARIVDLDLLLYGERIVSEDCLIIPHPRMHERRFVLEPMAVLAPAVRHPAYGKTMSSLREEVVSRETGQAIRIVADATWAVMISGVAANGRAASQRAGSEEGSARQ